MPLLSLKSKVNGWIKLWLAVFCVGWFLILTQGIFAQDMVKQPNVSGQFYSQDPFVLSRQLESMLSSTAALKKQEPVRILIVPHAGYIYSGRVAAMGYRTVRDKPYSTVVILAPSHFFAFEGISVWPEGAFRTPLGTVSVDEDFTKALLASDVRAVFSRKAFAKEHALEVQLPFIQKTMPRAEIVPVVIGQVSYDDCRNLARALDKIVGERDDVLLVASSDFSHYHQYEKAKEIDSRTLSAIAQGDAHYVWEQILLRNMEMCGFAPVVTAMLYARQRQLEGPDILQYANSGDVTGDKKRVVGYAALTYYAGGPRADKEQEGGQTVNHRNDEVEELSLEQKRQLIAIARQTIEQKVREGTVPEFTVSDPRLLRWEGAFVTINKKGKLRGCIGHIIGEGPLYRTVQRVAVSAALEDPRFEPLKEEELDDVEVEISVLSQPREIHDVEEIVLGKHGVIVSRGPFHRGVFLPQVATEYPWTREEFLSNLCAHKAGLPPDAWKDPKTRIEIFSAEVFSEDDVRKE